MNPILFFSDLPMHFSGGDDDQIKFIESNVRNLGNRIKRVLGDGHCTLYTISLGLTENDRHGDCSVESLKSKIKNEFSENKQFYSDFNHV